MFTAAGASPKSSRKKDLDVVLHRQDERTKLWRVAVFLLSALHLVETTSFKENHILEIYHEKLV